MNGGDHGRLCYASNHALIHRPRCRDAQRMAVQTSFAKKMTGSEDCNDRFLALFGNDRELDLALLDVKNRVRNLSLREDNLILPVFGYCFPVAHLGEKLLGIKRGFNSLPHHKGSRFFFIRAALSPDKGRARRQDYSKFQRGVCIKLLTNFIASEGRNCNEMTCPLLFQRRFLAQALNRSCISKDRHDSGCARKAGRTSISMNIVPRSWLTQTLVDNQIRATSPTTSVNDAAWIPALWMDSSELSGTSSRPAVFLQEGSQVIPPPTFAPSISQSSRPAASGLVVCGRGRIDDHSHEVIALFGAKPEQFGDESSRLF